MLFRTYCIAIEDLKEVKAALGYFPEWKNLGLNLELHPNLLEVILEDKHNVNDRLEEVLRNWLSKNYKDKEKDPTWSQLASAVETINGALSEQIKQQHPS